MKFHRRTTKKYLLSALLFNSVNCLSMHLNILPNNPHSTIATNNDQIYTVINSIHRQHPTLTAIIDEYYAEDKNEINQQVNAIRDMLDTQLGVNTNSYFRPIIGSIMSYYETTNLSQQQIFQKIDELESFLKECPANIKKQIFKTLSQHHWYVHYLIEANVQEHIKNFESVNYSTLNQLLNPDFSNDLSGSKIIIHELALARFINQSGIKRPIESVPYGKSGDIHFTVLYGHTSQIKSKSMIMSSDGKYLKATDNSDCTIIWDTEEGKQAQLTQDIEWSSGHVPPYMHDCTMDKTNSYAAFNILGSGLRVGKDYLPQSLAEMGQSAFPVEIDENKPAIILFKRPTLQSYLYQKVFNDSHNNHEQLSNLLQSLKNFKEVEGFPRKNLEQFIQNRLQELIKEQNSQSKL